MLHVWEMKEREGNLINEVSFPFLIALTVRQLMSCVFHFLLSVLYPFMMEGKVLKFVVGCDIDFILFYLFIYLSVDVPASSRVP